VIGQVAQFLEPGAQRSRLSSWSLVSRVWLDLAVRVLFVFVTCKVVSVFIFCNVHLFAALSSLCVAVCNVCLPACLARLPTCPPCPTNP
jgi:hypothetical protein